MDANGAIGVMDSGIGGLSVLRELKRMLPNEDFIYHGDNTHCPYGNRSKEEILALSLETIRFLQAHNVKCIVIACNTISTLAPQLRALTPVRIISIVEEAASCVIDRQLDAVGLIATQFTVSTGKYDELIHEKLPGCKVVSKGSPLLAGMVDRGESDADVIKREIRMQVDDILRRHSVKQLILGCTHYPIVMQQFRECYPDIEMIDPAREQAAAVRDYLQCEKLNKQGGKPRLDIFTSGSKEIFEQTCRRLAIPYDSVTTIHEA